MADVKQILVVDDHFEMLEFLRSMLELSNRGYQVLGVPSAEEAFLELRRTPFDLLITDVRLPGMSGFELVKKVQAIRPDMPIIMITAYSSAQGKQEAVKLGVFRYFQKPLDTDALLASVRQALYGEELRLPTPTRPEATTDALLANEINNCLQSLQTDTGAVQAALVGAKGKVLFETGRIQGLDINPLAAIVTDSLEVSRRLAEHLKSDEPLTIQYQSGRRFDLYTANVSRHFFLMIIFDARLRRGRIGTVWVFAQRTIKELKSLISRGGSAAAGNATPAAFPAPSKPRARRRPVEKTSKKPVPPVKTETASPRPEPIPIAPEPVPDDISHLQSDPLYSLFDTESDNTGVDLDAYWDQALNQDNDKNAMGGLSYEEALRQGLIPPDLSSPPSQDS